MINQTVPSNTLNLSGAKDTKNGAKKPAPALSPKVFTGEVDPEREKAHSSVFIPTWDNKPPEVKPVLSLDGSPILTYQNTSAIIAAPGVGKSSLCESIGAAFLNPACDSLGFELSEDCKGVLIIDNERTNKDVWDSFYRMCRRAGIPKGSEVKGVKIAGLRSIPRLKERLEVIEQLLQEGQYSLLVLDGAGDLVLDTNDLAEAIECRIWLREITVKYQLSILTTLHPNPGSLKPRGHIGSEVCREAECVLLAKSVDDSARLLTTDFEHGKNRNGAGVTTAYKWSDEYQMFITTDPEGYTAKPGRSEGAIRAKLELLAIKVIPAPKSLTRTELEDAIRQNEGCSESTAKRRVQSLLDFDLIKKYDDGQYRAIL